MREGSYFLATFKALYLVVSNILLTHTHTPIIYIGAKYAINFFCLRALNLCRIINKQRAYISSLCTLFIPLFNKQLRVYLRNRLQQLFLLIYKFSFLTIIIYLITNIKKIESGRSEVCVSTSKDRSYTPFYRMSSL